MIDLRSDTVTRPTPQMLESMQKAPVGDDVYGEDPTVNLLQDRLADLFGKEAALFCPSGTMCNQIAIKISTQPQDEVICDQHSHIYLYEGGGMAATSMVSARLLVGDRMRLSAVQVEESINDDNVHYPRTRLVSLENTCNKGGGCYYDLEDIAAISRVCKKYGLRMHLDGARVFNALVASGDKASDYGKYFDTISICLSKGLGAPVGSVLVGSKEDIKQADRVRKRLGGGMRQAGYIAAAGLYALDNHIERLKEDHRRAKSIESSLLEQDWVKGSLSVETNIVIFEVEEQRFSRNEVLSKLKDKGLLASSFGKSFIRMVTHLDFQEEDLEKAQKIIRELA